jgi:hypothetical protein
MGDRDFEEFLNENSTPSPDCPKKLLLDALRLKLNASSSTLAVYLKMPVKYEQEIADLVRISKEGFEQLDYLMSTIVDEIDDEENIEENPPESLL